MALVKRIKKKLWNNRGETFIFEDKAPVLNRFKNRISGIVFLYLKVLALLFLLILISIVSMV